MQNVKHHDVIETPISKGQRLRVGDGIQPSRRQDVGRDDMWGKCFKVSGSSSNLQRQTWPARSNNLAVIVLIQSAEDRFALPNGAVVAEPGISTHLERFKCAVGKQDHA